MGNGEWGMGNGELFITISNYQLAIAISNQRLSRLPCLFFQITPSSGLYFVTLAR
ncbi:MAG: hypothetical protein DSM106950_13875 [Stigonema ocellatum SAG 48.90 = DSM 106950]|nr:hypothetical protein [Stigonema ocellatum SAG 48.90 = DSM 106950]